MKKEEMKTCKNCIHYDVCALAHEEVKDCCKSRFADKSRYIELPCKVNSIVYIPKREYHTVFPCSIERVTIQTDGEQTYTSFDAVFMDIETGLILKEFDFDENDIDKTVFLTREEAEEKLKEILV